jgi:hypothetical protein
VAGSRGDLWYGHCLASLRLVVKLPRVGGNVDRLACRLHRPSNCGGQVMTQSLLTGIVPSHCPPKVEVSSSCPRDVDPSPWVDALPWCRPTFI